MRFYISDHCAAARNVVVVVVVAALSLSAVVAHGGHRTPPNVGTALYGRRDLTREWTQRDAVMLSGRTVVEQLLPRRAPPDGATFLRYWELLGNRSSVIVNAELRSVAVRLVIDAIGGYLHATLWPSTRTSYYEGRETYDVAVRLHRLLRKIKFFLGTDGRGWTTPTVVTDVAATTIVNHHHDDDNGADGQAENECDGLLLTAAKRVPIPAFDDDARPGSVAVPFATGQRLFGLHVPWTPLSRYYRMAVRCTADEPRQFRRDVNRWLNDTVRPLLTGSHRWYPALAGVLPVIRAAAAAVSANDDTPRSKRMAERASPLPAEPEVDWLSCEDDKGGDDGSVWKMLHRPVFTSYLLIVIVVLMIACLIMFVVRKCSNPTGSQS